MGQLIKRSLPKPVSLIAILALLMVFALPSKVSFAQYPPAEPMSCTTVAQCIGHFGLFQSIIGFGSSLSSVSSIGAGLASGLGACDAIQIQINAADRMASTKPSLMGKILARENASRLKFKLHHCKLVQAFKESISASSNAQTSALVKSTYIQGKYITAAAQSERDKLKKVNLTEANQLLEPTGSDCTRHTVERNNGQAEILTEAAADDLNNRSIATITNQMDPSDENQDISDLTEFARIEKLFDNVVNYYCDPDDNLMGEEGACADKNQYAAQLIDADITPVGLLGANSWNSEYVADAFDQITTYFTGLPETVMNVSSITGDGGKSFIDKKARQTKKALVAYLINHLAKKRLPIIENPPTGDSDIGVFNQIQIDTVCRRNDELCRNNIGEYFRSTTGFNRRVSVAEKDQILTYDRFQGSRYFQDTFVPKGGLNREILYNMALHLRQQYELLQLDEQFNIALATFYANRIGQ